MSFRIFTWLFAVLIITTSCKNDAKSIEETTNSQPKQEASQEIKYGYVLAASGMKLRENATLNSKALETIAYGEQVQILEQHIGEPFIALNMVGQFIKVKYKDQEGFAFDRLLSQYEMPQVGQDMVEYHKALVNYTPAPVFKEQFEDYDGYTRMTETLFLPQIDIYETFYITQSMHDLDRKLDIPAFDGSSHQEVPSTKKSEYEWKRDYNFYWNTNTKSLDSIHYYQRTEGGGLIITISPKQNGTQISQIYFAD